MNHFIEPSERVATSFALSLAQGGMAQALGSTIDKFVFFSDIQPTKLPEGVVEPIVKEPAHRTVSFFNDGVLVFMVRVVTDGDPHRDAVWRVAEFRYKLPDGSLSKAIVLP